MLATLAVRQPAPRVGRGRYRRVARPPTRARTPAGSPGSRRGRWSLDEFHAATATTAFQVLVDGVLVHAWYADGLGPRDLFLGASATKSVLAHLVGRGRALDLDAPVEAYVPELPAAATAGCRCATSRA